MDAQTFLNIYHDEAEKLVADYLARISRIQGAPTASKISERFWDFNVLMQELEQALTEKASGMMNLYGISGDQQHELQAQMRLVAREGCRKFNKLGKPGSG